MYLGGRAPLHGVSRSLESLPPTRYAYGFERNGDVSRIFVRSRVPNIGHIPHLIAERTQATHHRLDEPFRSFLALLSTRPARHRIPRWRRQIVGVNHGVRGRRYWRAWQSHLA